MSKLKDVEIGKLEIRNIQQQNERFQNFKNWNFDLITYMY